MKCETLRKRLSPFLDKELDPEATAGVNKHLETCTSCFGLYLQMKMDHARLRACVAPLRPEADSFAQRTMDSIELRVSLPGACDTEESRWGLVRAGLIPVALAASLACVGLFLAPLLESESGRGDTSPASLHADSGSSASRGQTHEPGSVVPGLATELPAINTLSHETVPRVRPEGANAEIGDLVHSKGTETTSPEESIDPADIVQLLIDAHLSGDETRVQDILSRLDQMKVQVHDLVTYLATRLQDRQQDPDLYRVLVEAMGAVGGESATRILMDLIEDEDRILHKRAMLAVMAASAPGDSTTLFLRLLALESDPVILGYAIRALGHIGSPEALLAIQNEIADAATQAEVRREAVRTLSDVMTDDTDDDSLLETLEYVVHNDNDMDTRILALRAIARMAPHAAERALDHVNRNDRLPRDLIDVAVRVLQQRIFPNR
jgi:hypothetical protein